MNIQRLAALLDSAARSARAIDQLSATVPLTIEEAYAVQRASIALRIARGDRRAGVKLGFTSQAKMIQMGISDLIWGRLTAGMRVEDGAAISLSAYIQPRVEPEIAFVLGKELAGTVSPAEALAAVDAIAPALEVIDSRYRAFRFSLPDVIADNASSSSFVLGPWCSPSIDVGNLGMQLEVDTRPVEIGSSASVLEHPLRALAAAARLAAQADEPLRPGDIVLSGGATAAIALRPGTHVRGVVEALGQVELIIEE